METITLALIVWTIMTVFMAVWTYRQGQGSAAIGLAVLALVALILIVLVPTPQSVPVQHPPITAPKPAPIEPLEVAPTSTEPDINKMVSSLAERLKTDKDDVEGHRMLARSYFVQGEIQKSIDTYLHVLSLVPNDVDSMTLLVEAMIERDEGELGPAALYWVQQAQSRDPMMPKVLWLAGLAAYQQRQYDIALAHWETLLPMMVGQADYDKLVSMIEQIKPTTD